MSLKKQIAVVCLILLAASVAASQAAQEPATKPAIADFQAEYLEDLKGLESKFLSIAASVPPEKYDWRPDDTVRSIREVLLHVASTNYTFPNMAGIKPPAAFDMRALLALPADPAKVRDAIAASFAHARAGVAALSASDLERAIQANWTVRRTLVFQLRHASEHLGQLIAYLRMNHITPAWTEQAQRRQQQQPPAKQPPAKPPRV
jgi:uncharacterized damage-inducible protein DinB